MEARQTHTRCVLRSAVLTRGLRASHEVAVLGRAVARSTHGPAWSRTVAEIRGRGAGPALSECVVTCAGGAGTWKGTLDDGL
jgi:hypothetical protein